MDKSWMNEPRVSEAYRKGVEGFLNFAFANASLNEEIVCPCAKCGNGIWVKREEAWEHLICDGFIKGYTKWIAHGEASTSRTTPSSSQIPSMLDGMAQMLQDRFGNYDLDNDGGYIEDMEMEGQENSEAKKFYEMLKEEKKELFPGCSKFSKLSFLVRLMNVKSLGKMTDKGFTMLLDLLNEAFEDAEIPKTTYEAKKIFNELGHGYVKIDACRNDCMLYWKDNAMKTECDVCHASRWLSDEERDVTDECKKDKKVAAKVLRHFPLIPRLKQLYMSTKTASSMRWHHDSRIKDGCMRHPADSPAWKTFDFKNPDFAKDPRNVYLALACDGFNPFRTMSSTHSTWPVVLMPYNLPPWMCMKQSFFMLSLLIPGPSAPGNNLDVYLQPLIDELKELWDDGVAAFDASKDEEFRLHAALLWTISDFPAYANLSGWSTKGELACPVCHEHTDSRWLKNSGKYCYMGHRRFLNVDHAFRKDKRAFDGTEEARMPPPSLSGSKVLSDLEGYEVRFGKSVKDNPSLPFSWKKLSIFFQLPYWKDNLLRHNLDVMHIEKNVCDSVLGTLLNQDGKTKDHLKARLDLEEMGIRPELHPVHEPNKIYLPPACFLMDKKEKEIFCRVLKGVKVPDGYSSNISRCVSVKPPKVSGLKSHDSHIMMQQLLPLALRRVLPKHVRFALIKLSRFFRELCAKVLRPRDLTRLETEIVVTLCELERIFPPSFFDIMVHLTIHLAAEARIAGPVHYRWMYLSTLKSYVRNRNRPEGSIAEGYIADECVTFSSFYFGDDVETRLNRKTRNFDGGQGGTGLPIFSKSGCPIRGEIHDSLDDELLAKAHLYVLFNCEAVDPFIKHHYDMVKHDHPRLRARDVKRIHNETFASWFENHENDLVCLKSIINPGVVVAKGIVYSTNASTIVGGEELGENWCEVLIQVVLNPNERLIRSYGFFKTVGDSIGASIAWPMTLLVADDDD